VGVAQITAMNRAGGAGRFRAIRDTARAPKSEGWRPKGTRMAERSERFASGNGGPPGRLDKSFG